MGIKFNLLKGVASNEVSLCSKYNSGANKKTEFELVKNKENTNNSNMKEILKNFVDIYDEMCVPEQDNCPIQGFKDFLEYWMQYDIDNTYYNLLSEGLQNGIAHIRELDLPKEEKEPIIRQLFDTFLEEYRSLPIKKSENGEYIVSLVEKSPIKDDSANPQNETNTTITKEKTSEMETKEEMNLVEKAIDTIVNALGLKKTESPTDETPEAVEQPVEETEKVEQPVEEAQVETPVVEEVVEEKTEEEPKAEEPVQEEVQAEQPAEEVQEPVQEEVQTEEPVEKTSKPSDLEVALEKAKNLENELAELKKQKEEQTIAIEKMSFVQKAKDEFSMLVGTPEEIGEKLYSISKSSLSDTEKDFIFEQFKKVSNINKSLTEEVGSITEGSEDMTDEQMTYKKAEEIAKSKGISVNKALRQIK